MTPQEKAKELLEKYINLTDDCDCLEYMCICFSMYDWKAKQCALIAVDEILDLNLGLSNCDENNWAIDEFYNEVKQEIEKL